MGLLLSAAATFVVGLIPYYLVWLALRRGIDEDTRSLAGNLLRASGTLLGLLLSLTFADVRSELSRLRDSVEIESAQIMDIYSDLGHYAADAKDRERSAADALRSELTRYTRVVVEEEWDEHASGGYSREAVRLMGEIKLGVLVLDGSTPVHASLRAELLEDVDEISDTRIDRLYHATPQPPFFLYISVVGYLCTMGLLGIYRPTARCLTLITLYAAFVGVVLYFILAMSHPFEGFAQVSPAPFELVLGDLMTGSETP